MRRRISGIRDQEPSPDQSSPCVPRDTPVPDHGSDARVSGRIESNESPAVGDLHADSKMAVARVVCGGVAGSIDLGGWVVGCFGSDERADGRNAGDCYGDCRRADLREGRHGDPAARGVGRDHAAGAERGGRVDAGAVPGPAVRPSDGVGIEQADTPGPTGSGADGPVGPESPRAICAGTNSSTSSGTTGAGANAGRGIGRRGSASRRCLVQHRLRVWVAWV